MRKLLFMAMLAGGGWWAWQNGLVPMPEALAGRSPAFATYSEFSESLARDYYGQARKLAAKGAIRTVQVYELRGQRNTRLGIGRRQVTKDLRERAALGEVTAVSHAPVSETASADGSNVKLRAIQTVCRGKSGCKEVEHDVELCRVEGLWKVCSFREI